MSEPKRKALPWRQHGEHKREVYDERRQFLFECKYPDDAAHIVRCVNAMPTMVEALKDASGWIADCGLSSEQSMDIQDQIFRAIMAYEEST